MKFDPRKTQKKRSDTALNNGSVQWVKKRTIEPQNIVIRLIQRSLNINHKTRYQSYRKFYQTITPNFTVCDIRKPPCFLRKFSPCGKFLIAFSADQTSVEIYDYLGAAAANELLYYCPIPLGDTVLQSNDPMVRHVLNNIFSRFFRLRHTVSVATNQEQLNRECSVFTSDGKYIIVCSASPRELTYANRPLADTNRTNESVTPNPRSPLDDYTLHIIQLDSGQLCDRVSFKHDKIFLSHNQGLSLYNKTLVVLSVQHQTLHVFHITDEGKFVSVQNIGRICFADDDVLLTSCIAHDCLTNSKDDKHSFSFPEHKESTNGSSNGHNGVANSRPSDEIHSPNRFVSLPSDSFSFVSNFRRSSEALARVVSSIDNGSDGSSGPPFPTLRPPEFRPSRVFSYNQPLSPPVPSPYTFTSRTSKGPTCTLHDHSEGRQIIYSLKHRLLVYLYKRAQEECIAVGKKTPLRQFYTCFDTYVQLRMLKMQLLDDKHLLIKYASEDVVTLRSSEPNSQPSYFVVYKVDEAKIVSVFENSSQELMELYERFTDFFRNARLPCEPNYFCSPANNIYARQLHEHHKSTLISSRGGGVTEASRRLLIQLPVACQAFSPSPYLDLNLFSYQDKWVSVMERPKTAADHPIRFFGRDSGLFKFSLDAGASNIPNQRRLVAFTFHPTDPFTISVQKNFDSYIVSFHLMHTPT